MDMQKEESDKFFSSFFNQVSLMNFDKCREMVEREKESQVPKYKNLQFKQFFTLLLNFIEAEKSYHNLGFMSTKKIFLRKDNSLKSVYESLRIELNKIEDANSPDQTTNSLIVQLIQYLTVRVQLIDFYEKIYLVGTGTKHIKYDELQHHVETIIESCKYSFLHPHLKSIRNILMNECEILLHLFGAHVELQVWTFIPCIMHLQAANSKLSTWEKSLQNKETWKLGFLKGSQLPQLYQWLHRLKSATLNKFTLYFYQVLSQQTTPQEMKNYLSTKHNTDFYLKLQYLQKKTFASSVLLLFDPSGLPDWCGPAFVHPNRSKEPITMSQYLVMVAHPPLKYGDRMVGISKALKERSPEYTLPDKVVSVYNAEDKCSYFISSIDPRITLVAIFDMKKDERDVNVVNYLTDFCTQVRCTKIYVALKVAK